MAGGIGSRFWPMSRTDHPKQFMDILGTGQSLLQQTFERFAAICPKENIYIVTNKDYKELIKEQLPEASPENVLYEPSRKNTAPCVAYASYKILKKNPNANIIVAPSDHLILKQEAFIEAINSCLEKAASEDCLITIGIEPTRPDTGYGYIQFVDSEKKEQDENMKRVKTFTEKPDADMAQFFLDSGDFLWNAGIFIWNIKSVIKAFENHLPEVNDIFKKGQDKYDSAAEEAFIETAYTNCKNISIDYGLMEKANNVYVRSANVGWSDLGTWGSLYELIEHDDNNNAVIGKNVKLYDSKRNIIHMPKGKLVVIQGMEDFIIVESKNTLLICKKENEQQIRAFVKDVKVQKGEKFV